MSQILLHQVPYPEDKPTQPFQPYKIPHAQLKLTRILALDIGSHQVRALQAEIDTHTPTAGLKRVLGCSVQESQGFTGGSVTGMSSLRSCIEHALMDINSQCGSVCEEAYVAVSGAHIQGVEARGKVPIRNAMRGPITRDITDALNSCNSDSLPDDCLVLHAIPTAFQVDDGPQVRNPVGIQGVQLTASTQVIFGDPEKLLLTARTVNKSGVQTEEMVFAPLAAAEATLTPTEKESGVCLLDIGTECSGLVVYQHGLLCFAATVPIGSAHVSSDIAYGLTIQPNYAEHLKIASGHCCPELTGDQELITCVLNEGQPTRRIRRMSIAQIVQPRMEELYLKARKLVQPTGIFDLPMASLVVTGGGARLPGADELAGRVFGITCRMGNCGSPEGLDDAACGPQMATVVGLAHYAATHRATQLSAAGGDDPLRAFYAPVVEMVKRRIMAL